MIKYTVLRIAIICGFLGLKMFNESNNLVNNNCSGVKSIWYVMVLTVRIW